MEKEALYVNQPVKCHVEEDMKHEFSGTIEKIYENSCLINILENDPEDNTAVSELNNKIVVSINSLS